MANRIPRVLLPDDDVVISFYNESSSVNMLCEKLADERGWIPNKRRIYAKLHDLGLDPYKFPVKTVTNTTQRNLTAAATAKRKFEEKTLPMLLVENCTFNPKTARSFICNWNPVFCWLEYKCQKCGNLGKWQGEKLTLQLDHKNGINTDNRVENLRYLCPNCHAQTEFFTGRNINSARKRNGHPEKLRLGGWT